MKTEKLQKIKQKIEKLMRSLSTKTREEIPTPIYINTTMGSIGEEEIQFWSNFEAEEPQIVDEIYELVKEAYEVMNP